MRFLNTETLAFEVVDYPEPKSFAILSHTWGDGEVTFQDMEDLKSARLKAGFDKIAKTCTIAGLEGYSLAWVDTCCIDKTSSSELSEAINSMFALYADSGMCYVYLRDYHSDVFVEHEFAACRWFTRGWTLQELIAPDEMRFYQASWQAIGTKRSLLSPINDITRIPAAVLEDRQAIWGCCIAQRMSWAAGRVTTKYEDIAYCLLGLFGVNMPALYGMRQKAFLMLQEEIIKSTNDLSIFAWADRSLSKDAEHGVLAQSPAVFRDCGNLVLSNGEAYKGYFELTNYGLRIKAAVNPRAYTMPFVVQGHGPAGQQTPLGSALPPGDPAKPGKGCVLVQERICRLGLFCHDPTIHDGDIMLVLRKQGDGTQYCRVQCNAFVTTRSSSPDLLIPPTLDMFIATTAQQLAPTGYIVMEFNSKSPEIRLDVVANFPNRHWDLWSAPSGRQCRFRLTARFLGLSLIRLSHHCTSEPPHSPLERIMDIETNRPRTNNPGVYLLVAFWLEPQTSGGKAEDPCIKCSIHCRQPSSDTSLMSDRAELKIVGSSVGLSDAQSMLRKQFAAFGKQQFVYVANVPRGLSSVGEDMAWSGWSGTVSVPEMMKPMHYDGSKAAGDGKMPPFRNLAYSVQVKADIKSRPAQGCCT